ncbi:MAG: hypothetical protein TUN42_09250 [Dehalogenimonas sp.]
MSQENTTGENAQYDLLKWIGQQNLESTTVLGILCLCRLADQHPDKLPELEKLNQKLHKPSLLSFELLRRLYGDRVTKPNWTRCHSGETPSGFEPQEFFEKYRTNFLPPIYDVWMKEIERKTNLPMFKQWAFEWSQLVSTFGYEPSVRVLDFQGRPPGPRILVDFPLSEVYRSAYLRSLAWAVTKGRLPEDVACFFACKACPVDLDLWRVQPKLKPSWWPAPKMNRGMVDTIPVELSGEISHLWDKRHDFFDGNALLAADGSVISGNETYRLSIRAMFQAAYGPNPGDPREIMKACDEVRLENKVQSGVGFNGSLKLINPEDTILMSGDWSLLPASISVRPSLAPRWQYWRGYHGIQLPAPYVVSKEFSFHCESDSIRVYDGNIQIGYWQDWNDGLTEEFENSLPQPHGWALYTTWDFIEKVSRLSNSTFCWVFEIKGFHRDHEYEKFREYSIVELRGATNLILPI